MINPLPHKVLKFYIKKSFLKYPWVKEIVTFLKFLFLLKTYIDLTEISVRNVFVKQIFIKSKNI